MRTTALPLLALPFLGAGAAAIEPTDTGLTVCAIALCTGTACPGCGMLRALASLADGDLGAASGYHPLVFLLAFEVAIAAIAYAFMSDRAKAWAERLVPVVAVMTALAFVGVWALRAATGALPPV